MGWIPISLYSSEFREGYLYPCRTQSYPCIAQGLGKDGLDIPISLQDSELSQYSLGSRKGWVGYIYPCRAQSLGKDWLNTYILVNVQLRGFVRMGWLPISMFSLELSEGLIGYLYPIVQLRVNERMSWIPISLDTNIFERMGWIKISLYSSESREGWVGYLYPSLSQGPVQDGLDSYILVQLRVQGRMSQIPISLYSLKGVEFLPQT